MDVDCELMNGWMGSGLRGCMCYWLGKAIHRVLGGGGTNLKSRCIRACLSAYM